MTDDIKLRNSSLMLAEIKRELIAQGKLLSSVIVEVKNKNEEVNKLSLIADNLRKEISNLSEIRSKLIEDITDDNDKYAEEVKKRKKVIDDLNEQSKELEKSLKVTNLWLVQAKDDERDKKLTLEKINKTILEGVDIVKSDREEIERLEAQRIGLVEENKGLRAVRKSEVDDHNRLISDLKDKISLLENEIKVLTVRQEQMTAEIYTRKKDLEIYMARIMVAKQKAT